jgi:hypothetical protein
VGRWAYRNDFGRSNLKFRHTPQTSPSSAARSSPCLASAPAMVSYLASQEALVIKMHSGCQSETANPRRGAVGNGTRCGFPRLWLVAFRHRPARYAHKPRARASVNVGGGSGVVPARWRARRRLRPAIAGCGRAFFDLGTNRLPPPATRHGDYAARSRTGRHFGRIPYEANLRTTGTLRGVLRRECVWVLAQPLRVPCVFANDVCFA